MGQYGNQPDFGTKAANVTPYNDPSDADNAISFAPAALYIGTGGTLVCRVVGGNAIGGTQSNGFTVFKNIPNGTFFPVVVTTVWNNDGSETTTTCSDIVALY